MQTLSGIYHTPAPDDYISCTITISGLHGGHSGFEIHLGRQMQIYLQ